MEEDLAPVSEAQARERVDAAVTEGIRDVDRDDPFSTRRSAVFSARETPCEGAYRRAQAERKSLTGRAS